MKYAVEAKEAKNRMWWKNKKCLMCSALAGMVILALFILYLCEGVFKC